MWTNQTTDPILIASQTKNATCAQCSGRNLKYIEFLSFPQDEIEFQIAKNNVPSGSSGIIQVHYWTSLPNTTPPPTARVFLASVLPGGKFKFKPTPTRKYLSLYKFNGSNFDAICFTYLDELKLFVPQAF